MALRLVAYRGKTVEGEPHPTRREVADSKSREDVNVAGMYEMIGYIAATNYNASPEELDRLSTSPSEKVRAAIPKHKNVLTETLSHLADDKSKLVRYNVIMSKNTDIAILEHMLQKEEKEFAQIIKMKIAQLKNAQKSGSETLLRTDKPSLNVSMGEIYINVPDLSVQIKKGPNISAIKAAITIAAEKLGLVHNTSEKK